MLSASSSPWEEHNIKRLYKPYEAERAKATDDLKIEDGTWNIEALKIEDSDGSDTPLADGQAN